jgi:hypothetical protein
VDALIQIFQKPLAYSREASFHDIHGCAQDEGTASMTSHSLANVLGWIVLVVVLGAAVFYGPLGQFGKPKPATAVQQAAPATAPPAPKGPVILEVPN